MGVIGKCVLNVDRYVQLVLWDVRYTGWLVYNGCTSCSITKATQLDSACPIVIVSTQNDYSGGNW